MLELLDASPPEPILKLIAEHRNDPRAEKVDLGVGVYRNAQGATPILPSVKVAERWLVESQASKAYLGSRGDNLFCEAIEELVFASAAHKIRTYTLQTPGGSGALRVAASLILKAVPDATVWIGEPTWDNHVPLLGGAGLNIQRYPYYSADTHDVCFDAMLESLADAAPGDIILLHACCHNPTGMDLAADQWRQLTEFVVDRDLVPLIDFAYHGFANGIDEDAHAVRLMAERVPELFVAYSCSKNFGLYRDRVGSVSIISDRADLQNIDSQAQTIVRTMYSMPPDHGAALVTHILNDLERREQWLEELATMRLRMKDMRRQLAEQLLLSAPQFDSSHIERGNGMFCILGLDTDQVHRLKQEFGVYLVDSSRINICGLTAQNAGYVASSISAVL